MDAIYLDHAATTPMHPDVVTAMVEVMNETFGNSSSIHQFGRRARALLDQARRFTAQTIHADEKEIIFTSGGTEADNLAVIGTAYANQEKGKHIITTEMEHHATLHAANYLEEQGFEVTYLPVNETGRISLTDFDEALREDTILVSMMMVNNEVGIIQPIEQVGQRLKEHQAYFHTDAVQAYSLLDINVQQLGVDLLTVSGHKINGPKGVGFLYAKSNVRLHPIQYGGTQERTRRPGTENVAAIVGFHRAMELAFEDQLVRTEKYRKYQTDFVQRLKDAEIDFSINGELEDMVPTIVNISFPGANVESLLMNLDLAGIAASSGSACTAGSVEPSHVLTAMYGSDDLRAMNSIRFSFGLANTTEQIEIAAERVIEVLQRLVSK
ncbi:cysteine desulfurase [Natronobacillus azotifigens]|uniref:cysteine desulfurase n=1 Tax=Natronobacillus azotifigens TaxID=472978 RepID=A0A9J6R9M2_9BACI|nr:cysteine desulfurase family protein [Natronobacillus azotifigens]MCZ0702344.1 cysteine desulfurase family protein [Natronobacillus azotifigens]